MLYNELLTKLTYLTRNNNLTHKEIGEAVNVERRAMSGRAERNSRFKDSEINAVEKYFNIDFSNISISENSFQRQNDTSIPERASKFSSRLLMLQEKSGLNDNDFAQIIGLEKDEYVEEFKNGDRKPNLKILNLIKQHFKVSIDWLLYGE